MSQPTPYQPQPQRALPQQWQQTTSPDSYMPPPAKRQRLSPNPPSPYSQSPSSPYSTASPNPYSLPAGAFGATQSQQPLLPQQQQQQVNGASSDTPHRAIPGSMGPPERPVEKDKEKEKIDVNSLSDLVTASGIDLRAEEDYLAASYRQERNDASFGSQSTQVTSPGNSFDLLSQGQFGTIGNQGPGNLGQPVSQRSFEEELFEKHRRAARAYNEQAQFHLNDPFLYGHSVRKRMEAVCREADVPMPLDGLWDRTINSDSGVPSGAAVRGPNGAIVSASAPSVLSRGVPLDAMFSLISLAAKERIRGLLEDAFGLSRGRQAGADGVVPPEWTDLAQGTDAQDTTTAPVSITGSAWDAAIDAQPNPLPSPPNSDIDPSKAVTGIDSSLSQALPTIVFRASNATNVLRSLNSRDRKLEEARFRKRSERAKRKAQAAADAAIASGAATPSGETSSNPVDGIVSGAAAATDSVGKPLPAGMKGEVAPEAPKMTKKERERLAKQEFSEDLQVRETNQAISKALGGKQYSWLSGGAKKAPPKPMGSAAKVSGSSTAGGGAAVAVGGAVTGVSSGGGARTSSVKDTNIGDFREDGGADKGVQMRDWIATLEEDGKAKKTLVQAYLKLGRDKHATAGGQAAQT